MSLPTQKVYVNSRYKTSDSISDSHFKIELPYVLTMPHNSILYITDACIPTLVKTISRGENDPLYVLSGSVFATIIIPPGNYTELGFAQASDQQLKEHKLELSLQSMTPIVILLCIL